MYVVGTAGHVDHGKSTLVRALTGIDPDRLQEEKERGMTIDLGFAWLQLPSGREVSIVDVPGHERFIKNMLAGVGGIDVALLVVAADESVMPQTEEHLAILDLLRVKNGIVVLTKIDTVEPDWLELVHTDVAEKLVGTVLEGAPIVPVSAMTGEGLDELRAKLDELLERTPAKRDVGKPRLPIDRVFTVAGFGTIVTGTLIDGRFQVGQEAEIFPSGLKTRIRGIQSHKHKVDSAQPGTRVALNLVGLATTDVQRGNVVAPPRSLDPTVALDARLTVLKDAARPVEHNAPVTFHSGAAESLARVRLLDTNALEPGQTGWAQIRLDDPIALAKSDLFIIRSTEATVGGGEVVEVHAKRHKRFQPRLLQKLETLAQGTPEDLLISALQDKRPLELSALAKQTGLALDAARAAAQSLAGAGQVVQLDGYLLSISSWEGLVESARQILAGYHRQHRFRLGMPKEELRGRLGLTPKLFAIVLAQFVQLGVAADEGALVRLAEHRVELTPEQERQIERLFELLQVTPYTPPGRAELEAQLGLDPELIDAVADQGRLRKVGDDLVYPTSVYEDMVAQVVALIKEHGKITVAQVRDQFGASRKFSLALMEHLDETKVTRRVGDERVLR